MDIGDFIINGVSSRDIQAKIQRRPVIEIPQRKTIENDEIPFRSGSLLFDDEGYRNTNMSLEMYIRGNSFEEASTNRNKVVELFQQGQYNEFIPYFDSDKTYYVRLVGGSFNGERIYGYTQPIQLALSVKPFKRLNESYPIEMMNGDHLINPTAFESTPKITIEGSGDINLTVGEITMVLRGVSGSIILDSEIMNAYKMVNNRPSSQNDKVHSMDFPLLKQGKNTISWTGSVTKLTIEPRWQVLT